MIRLLRQNLNRWQLGLVVVLAVGLGFVVVRIFTGVQGMGSPSGEAHWNATNPSASGQSTGSGSPSGSASPSASPSARPTPSASPTPKKPVAPLSACPPAPSFPDANCTGYAHTGVTLHQCPSNLVSPTYDSCLFTGNVSVSAANIKITRSKIVGTLTYKSGDDGSLRGVTLTDVEIDSTNYQGGAAIGNNDYTCVRCNVHGGTRGFNVGYHVTIRDSYSHGWHSQDGDHITGLGSNGGAHNVIDHNNISCDILNDPSGYACSSGMSVYGDDAPGNDDWTITNNLLNSGSSYCMVIAGPPSKPYPFTNVRVIGNHFGNMGARARGLPDSQCSEFGPINEPDGVHQWNAGTTNVWNNNVDSTGRSVGAPN